MGPCVHISNWLTFAEAKDVFAAAYSMGLQQKSVRIMGRDTNILVK